MTLVRGGFPREKRIHINEPQTGELPNDAGCVDVIPVISKSNGKVTGWGCMNNQGKAFIYLGEFRKDVENFLLMKRLRAIFRVNGSERYMVRFKLKGVNDNVEEQERQA